MMYQRQRHSIMVDYHLLTGTVYLGTLLLEGEFRIIHIPLKLYKSLLQPILRIILPQNSENDSTKDSAGLHDSNDKHGFLNVSITPSECTVICHKTWATTLFVPAFAALSNHLQSEVSISQDVYSVFSVSSSSTEAGSRILELTSPLAMAGVPIFFITTYYTDFIVVPARDYQVVADILLSKGFEFSDQFSAFIVPCHTKDLTARGRASSRPSTPPPNDFSSLHVRTLEELRKQGVMPFIVPGLRIVQCSIKETPDDGFLNYNAASGGSGSHWTDAINSNLWLTLVSTLTLQPRFLSLTLAKDHPLTLLLDKQLLSDFGDMLAGDTSGFLVPIFLDLSKISLQSTGIVCGVAGTLVADVEEQRRAGSTLDISELSYLSTAKAGTVILSEAGAARGMEVLMPLLLSPE